MSYNDKKVMIIVNARKHLEEIIIFNTEQTLENYIKENPNIKRLGLVARDYVWFNPSQYNLRFGQLPDMPLCIEYKN